MVRFFQGSMFRYINSNDIAWVKGQKVNGPDGFDIGYDSRVSVISDRDLNNALHSVGKYNKFLPYQKKTLLWLQNYMRN